MTTIWQWNKHQTKLKNFLLELFSWEKFFFPKKNDKEWKFFWQNYRNYKPIFINIKFIFILGENLLSYIQPKRSVPGRNRRPTLSKIRTIVLEHFHQLWLLEQKQNNQKNLIVELVLRRQDVQLRLGPHRPIQKTQLSSHQLWAT